MQIDCWPDITFNSNTHLIQPHTVHNELMTVGTVDAVIMTQTDPMVTRGRALHKPTRGLIICTLWE